nr:hypothetical protein GCM10020092_000270 [Actinoplanes digitatis]
MPIRSPSEPPPALPNSLCKPSAAVLMSGNVTGESRGGASDFCHTGLARSREQSRPAHT